MPRVPSWPPAACNCRHVLEDVASIGHSAALLTVFLRSSLAGSKLVLGLLPAQTMAYLKWLLALKKKDGKAKGGGEAWLGITTSENGVSYVAADSLESLIEIERTPVLQVERATPPRDRGPER